MPIVVMTIILAVGADWHSAGGQLLASGLALLCGHQDIRMRIRAGASFWFMMALAFGISALATAVWASFWGGALICTVVLCFEIRFIRRWWNRRTSP